MELCYHLQHLNPIADGFAPIIDLVDVKLTEFQVGLMPTLIGIGLMMKITFFRDNTVNFKVFDYWVSHLNSKNNAFLVVN